MIKSLILPNLIITSILISCSSPSQLYISNKHRNNFFAIYDKKNIIKYYETTTNRSFIDYYLKKSKEINNQHYQRRIREYSWGIKDTAYIRTKKSTLYHFDPEIEKESLVIPANPKKGKKWFEADSSWSYLIKNTSGSIKTPARKYDSLLVIKCKKLKNKNPNKGKLYTLYYKKGIGLVAGEQKGNLSSYLKKIEFKEPDSYFE